MAMRPVKDDLVSKWDKLGTSRRIKLVLEILSSFQTCVQVEKHLGIKFILFFNRITVFFRLNYCKLNVDLSPILTLLAIFLQKRSIMINFLEIGGCRYLYDILNEAKKPNREKVKSIQILLLITKNGKVFKEILCHDGGLQQIFNSLYLVKQYAHISTIVRDERKRKVKSQKKKVKSKVKSKRKKSKHEKKSSINELERQKMEEDTMEELLRHYELLFKALSMKNERYRFKIEDMLFHLLIKLTLVPSKLVVCNVLNYLVKSKVELTALYEKEVLKTLMGYLIYDELNEQIVKLILHSLKSDKNLSRFLYEQVSSSLHDDHTYGSVIAPICAILLYMIDVGETSMFESDIVFVMIWKASVMKDDIDDDDVNDPTEITLMKRLREGNNKKYYLTGYRRLGRIINFFFADKLYDMNQYNEDLEDIIGKKYLRMMKRDEHITDEELLKLQDGVDEYFLDEEKKEIFLKKYVKIVRKSHMMKLSIENPSSDV